MRFWGSVNCFQSVALRMEFHSLLLEDEEEVVSGVKVEDIDEVIELSLSFSSFLASLSDPEDQGGHRMTVIYSPPRGMGGVPVGLGP